MAKKRKLTVLVSVLLTFTAVFGGLGCLASGMDLNFHAGLLFWGCLLMALLFSLCWDTRLWLLPLGMAALLLGYWWQESTLRLSLESLIYHITDLYDRGYNWGVVHWSDRALLQQDTAPALLALGLPIAATVSLSVVKGKACWLGAGVALLPMLVCVGLTDTVPEAEYLALLLFAVILLLMTGHLRRSSHRQANRLTLTLVLPLTLALALLFTFCPREGYHMQSGAQKLEDFVLWLLDRAEVPESLQAPVLIPGDQERTVQLSQAGKRSYSGEAVMTVLAQETGTIYLRGCAYDIYDGTSWSSTPGWNAWNTFYTPSPNAPTKTLTIRTKRPHSVLYFTYAPQNAPEKVLGGRMRNAEGLTEYTVQYAPPLAYGSAWYAQESQVGGQQLSEYLQLPDSTRKEALDILSRRVGIPGKTENIGQIWENAQYIVQWVSRRADYNLRTDKMPAGEEDFALWFLKDADTGYCTHYATAATVLLRAAGIPAQYVTGYLVEAKAGQAVTVTDADAHAWVEVFINGVGWVMLEPTPAQGLSGSAGNAEDPTLPSQPTVSTEATEPQQTEEVTEPQQTEEVTQPAQTEEVTEPQQTDESTEPATAPAQTGIGGTEPGSPARQSFGKVLLWLLGVIGLLLAVMLQWRVRVAYKARLCRRGDHNTRALRLWKQLDRACRLAGTPPAEESYWLAQKARFSQHTISAQELHALKLALNEVHGRLRKRHFLHQLVYTLIFAVY